MNLDDLPDLFDAAVVGAGPAGSVAAAELARRGASVLLVDAAVFPRAKVCGCCLNGAALAALDAAGLGDLPARLGAVALTRFRLAAGGCESEIALPEGRALSRESFDFALARAAVGRGATFLPGTRAILESGDSETLRLRLTAGAISRTVGARVVVAADGLGGGLLARAGLAHAEVRTRSRIGAGAVFDCAEHIFAPGVIHMASGRGGYVGLVRLEDGRLDVAAALDPAALRKSGGLANLAADVLTQAGWPVPAGLRETHWRGTPALTRRLGRVAWRRLFVIGDAAGYVEPFTGEGMAWAMASAVAVAPLAARATTRWQPRLADAWQRRHRLLARRRIVSRVAAELLRRPTLTWAVAAGLSLLPALAAPVVSLLNQGTLELREAR